MYTYINQSINQSIYHIHVSREREGGRERERYILYSESAFYWKRKRPAAGECKKERTRRAESACPSHECDSRKVEEIVCLGVGFRLSA